MVHFFIQGGFGMYPVLVIGLIILYASVRYLIDGEPVRLRFILVLSLAHLAMIAQASVANVAATLQGVKNPARVSLELLPRHVAVGLMESTRPALLGLGLLALSLVLLAIGVYRVGNRELKAARGA